MTDRGLVDELDFLLRDSWPSGSEEVLTKVSELNFAAFGAKPTVEMLATAEDDHLAELSEELRKSGLAHAKLFKTALDRARKWRAEEDCRSSMADAVFYFRRFFAIFSD